MVFVYLLFNLDAQENVEKKNKSQFANKIIFFFGLQYNNAFHAKDKFENRDAATYQMAAHPFLLILKKILT